MLHQAGLVRTSQCRSRLHGQQQYLHTCSGNPYIHNRNYQLIPGVLATKGIPLRIAADREKGRAGWRRAGLPAQSLRCHRFRRALRAFICIFCMRVCIYVYVCMCADMIHVYICMCVRICTSMRLYTCVCVCVCIFVHRLWVLVSVLQRVDDVMHAHVFSCAYACVYISV